MQASKHAKLFNKETEQWRSWGDFLVSAWVLLIAFAICGIITLVGFPVGWKEVATDYSAASAQSGEGAALEASAVRAVAR